ncbi:hypothetical protein WN51_08656 [Melipona quadrifasciata]|uniref:Uncharacterized protein n=1 Tax=Melipona quadrifasciata TaxID=166423 RepID=A0A0M9A7N5_9HYME|nr:hypothetical protein WN51_08656 [Melipona quadrifasciata]
MGFRPFPDSGSSTRVQASLQPIFHGRCNVIVARVLCTVTNEYVTFDGYDRPIASVMPEQE